MLNVLLDLLSKLELASFLTNFVTWHHQAEIYLVVGDGNAGLDATINFADSKNSICAYAYGKYFSRVLTLTSGGNKGHERAIDTKSVVIDNDLHSKLSLCMSSYSTVTYHVM